MAFVSRFVQRKLKTRARCCSIPSPKSPTVQEHAQIHAHTSGPWFETKSIRSNPEARKAGRPGCRFLVRRRLHHSVTQGPLGHLEGEHDDVKGEGGTQPAVELEQKANGGKSIRGVIVHLLGENGADHAFDVDVSLAKSLDSRAREHQSTLQGTGKGNPDRGEGPSERHSHRLAKPIQEHGSPLSVLGRKHSINDGFDVSIDGFREKLRDRIGHLYGSCELNNKDGNDREPYAVDVAQGVVDLLRVHLLQHKEGLVLHEFLVRELFLWVGFLVVLLGFVDDPGGLLREFSNRFDDECSSSLLRGLNAGEEGGIHTPEEAKCKADDRFDDVVVELGPLVVDFVPGLDHDRSQDAHEFKCRLGHFLQVVGEDFRRVDDGVFLGGNSTTSTSRGAAAGLGAGFLFGGFGRHGVCRC
mmetsp:Transcript_19713/g.45002  ORF Transcript_19713/g.45002 Transcript_19713/m.45002 type:complete len:413 (-) Transcript_19713:199-1437(-)